MAQTVDHARDAQTGYHVDQLTIPPIISEDPVRVAGESAQGTAGDAGLGASRRRRFPSEQRPSRRRGTRGTVLFLGIRESRDLIARSLRIGVLVVIVTVIWLVRRRRRRTAED